MCKHERLIQIMSRFEGGVEAVFPPGKPNLEVEGWCPDCGALQVRDECFIFPKFYLHSAPPTENLPVCEGQGLHSASN